MNKDRELQLCYLTDWREIWSAVIEDDQTRLDAAVTYHARRVSGHSGATLSDEVQSTHARISKGRSEARQYLARIERELKR